MKRLLFIALVLTLAACGGDPTPEKKSPKHPALREMHNVVAPLKGEYGDDAKAFKILPASASPITFARMAKHPEPGWNVPRGVHHAPDGKTITYLASESGDETMSLMSFDATTGKSSVLLRAKDLVETEQKRSREEELRRERQRDRNEGITNHDWAKKAQVLLIPHAGDIFVRDFLKEPQGRAKRLTKTTEAEIDPSLCASGERVAFVRGTELFSIDVATGKETQLTSPVKDPKTNLPIADGGITHGQSDFVAQEELGESSGYFWSPKCDRIAYLEVDERPVDKIPVLGYRGEADLMMQRYPRSGTKNPVVRAGIVDLATKKTTWLSFTKNEERYHGHFLWSEDGASLYVQTLTRDQKHLSLIKVDASNGKATEIASESSSAWVEFSPMKLVGPDSFLFTSTKTGHRHIELRSQKDGALLRTLTSGPWDVTSVALDEKQHRVLFSGTKDSPIERHLYSTSLEGGAIEKLTSEHGVHSVRINETGSVWIDVHSASDRLPRAVVVRDGKPAGDLPMPPVDADIKDLGLRATEHITLKTPSGETIHGALLKPRTMASPNGNGAKHPAIVMVYGGPEAQLVFDVWSPHLMWQHLADRGFTVLQIDNRGSGGQGLAFAQKVHKQLGRLELEDQVTAAKWLGAQPYVDASRIGIYGHSYGGFMAALAMLDSSSNSVFKAAVAGSPVTDWRLYDTGYTERYMETPQTNAAGYEASDLSKKAANLKGKLLITHAMMDENVHYAHTAKLVDALIANNKHFDLLVLPGERHGVRAPAVRTYMPERIVSYFADNL